MDKIKALWEKWNHRLQGHMLVTLQWSSTVSPSQFWIKDVYVDDGVMWADIVGDGDPLPLCMSVQDITITGA